jgi:hypothetical protein
MNSFSYGVKRRGAASGWKSIKGLLWEILQIFKATNKSYS